MKLLKNLGRKNLVHFLIFLTSFTAFFLVCIIKESQYIIFQLGAAMLWGLSFLFGVTYVEMNIIVYYIFIPITWLIMLDYIFKVHYFKIGAFIGYLLLFLNVESWIKFCAWAFRKSVIIVNYPYPCKVELTEKTILDTGIIKHAETFVGPYYIQNSVIICVFVPVLIYTVLLYLLIKQRDKRLRNKQNV